MSTRLPLTCPLALQYFLRREGAGACTSDSAQELRQSCPAESPLGCAAARTGSTGMIGETDHERLRRVSPERFRLTAPAAEPGFEVAMLPEVGGCCGDVTRSERFSEKSISKVSAVGIDALACERASNHGCIEE